MNRYRASAAIAAALTAALAIAGCSTGGSGDSGSDSKGAQLAFLTFETPALDATFWKNSIDAALKDLPGVTVKNLVSPDADRTAYAKQLQASGQFPDVLSSINARDFVDAKLLEPYTDSWLEENFLEPTATNIDGKAYIPPTNAQVLPIVFYNKKIFADNGITEPKTWAEFEAIVKKLKGAGVTPLELAGSEPWAASMPLVALASADVLGKDPNWIQDRYDGKVKFTDPEFQAAMQKELDLIKDGAYSKSALSVDFATANKNFLDGKSAMYPMGSWFTGSGYVTPEQADNIGAFPWPTDDGSVVLPLNVGGTTAVSSNSKHKKDAVDFAKAWSLAPQNMKILIETDGAIPMMKKLSIADYGAKTNSLYTSLFNLATGGDKKVSAFGWVTNDDALAPGVGDEFYALSQALFSNTDLPSQLKKLDEKWDAGAKG